MKIIPIQRFEDELAYTRSVLEKLVNIESPSTDKAAVDSLALYIIQELESLDGSISIFPPGTDRQ